jgi:hypothetical protein
VDWKKGTHLEKVVSRDSSGKVVKAMTRQRTLATEPDSKLCLNITRMSSQ